MKKICFNVKEDGFYGTYWSLKEKTEYAFIACIGDDANDYLACTVVKWLHKQGFNVLTMSPNKKDYGHHNYPLERIEMAIHYLKNYGNSKICIIGASTTGTLALTVASMFKDISLTIALTPSDFIWQGFKQGKKDGCKEWPIKNESLFSYHGNPLPYMEFCYQHPEYWHVIEKEIFYNSSTYERVDNFRNSYYYYTIKKPSSFSKMVLYVYTNQNQGQDSDYYFASDTLTNNTNYDTLIFNNNRVEWTNKQTSRPGGGFDEGNKDKGDHSTKGIKASNEIYILNGDINIKSYDDSIHVYNDDILENGNSALGNFNIQGGNISLYSNDDGIHADNKVTIDNGTINITNSYEGIEGAFVEIKDGTISVVSSDDGINGASTIGESIIIGGGTIYVLSGGDGVDSNSRSSYDGILFNGGKSVIISYGQSDSSIDTENGYKYTGGYVLGIGLSGGMSNESLNSSPSFNSIGKNVRLNLQVNNILIVENIVEVKMSKAMNASVVYLNSNNVNISTGSSTNTFDNNGVNWLV